MAIWIYVDVQPDGKISSLLYKGQDAVLVGHSPGYQKLAFGSTVSQSLRSLAAQLTEKKKGNP